MVETAKLADVINFYNAYKARIVKFELFPNFAPMWIKNIFFCIKSKRNNLKQLSVEIGSRLNFISTNDIGNSQ